MVKKESVLPLVVGQGLLVILFFVFATYKENENIAALDVLKYPIFQDVHVMIFIGFGFLMTFLKRFGYSSLGFTLLLGSFMIQWAMLCQGFFDINDDYEMELGIDSMYKADIAAATVLISVGAVFGRTTMTELLIMGIIEIPLYCTNLYLGSRIIKVTDAGGSIFVHVFGAYFGLAVSYVINRRKNGRSESGNSLQESTYTSDLFSMIGTIFLWLYWPSFNAVDLANALQMQRAIINTYLALTSCVVAACVCSLLTNPEGKFEMVHLQNSTLAGGVAIGAAANLKVTPGGALVVGVVAGGMSVLGFSRLTPFIESSLRIPDTCGVHNLHGMPAVFAAVISSIMTGLPSYGEHDPLNIESDRAERVQAWHQLLGLVATLLIAIIGGLITGFVLNYSKLRPLRLSSVPKTFYYDDALSWTGVEASGTYKQEKQETASASYDNAAVEFSLTENQRSSSN